MPSYMGHVNQSLKGKGKRASPLEERKEKKVLKAFLKKCFSSSPLVFGLKRKKRKASTFIQKVNSLA